jgi:hypothetical protein
MFDGKLSAEDVATVASRLAKYLAEGLVVALAAALVPRRKLEVTEVAVVALAAATTFAILDTFFPSISAKVRAGAGWALGSNLIGLQALGA